MTLYDIYLDKLTRFLFEMDYDFFVTYAPGTLNQFSLPTSHKMKKVTEEQLKRYRDIALNFIDKMAPDAIK